MNSVFLLGRLTKEPKAMTTSTNKTCCKFDIAVNTGYGDNAKVDYINIVVWGNLADNCIKYLQKGSQVLVEGRLNTGKYTNKEGKTVYTTDVIASKIEFIGKKNTETPAKQTTLDELHEVEDDETMPF